MIMFRRDEGYREVILYYVIDWRLESQCVVRQYMTIMRCLDARYIDKKSVSHRIAGYRLIDDHKTVGRLFLLS
jgi:hypothetical protein